MTLVKERIERKLEASGRITPREVLEAYEETGLQPIQGEWFYGQQACALGALAFYHGYDRDEDGKRSVVEWLGQRGSSYRYMMSFAAGFDDRTFLEGVDDPVAYRDGTRLRRFVESRYGTLS